MTELAEHEILVTSDSDVEVAPNYLREVVAPLLDPKVGMVTCVYRARTPPDSGRADAIGMSVEMTAGVLVANLLEGMKFGLGPTIAVKKEALARIGGYQHWRLLRQRLHDRPPDRRSRLSRRAFTICHRACGQSEEFSSHVDNQFRWAKSTRYSRRKAFRQRLDFRFALRTSRLVAAIALGKTGLGLALLGAALLNRILESWLVGWGVVRDPWP